MKIKVTSWKASTLYRLRDKINEQPIYQRGEVWSDKKKSILIDSMLRGIDIPKIYLRKLKSNAHEYEVADGQQRLTAIIKFFNNEIKLLDEDEKGLNLRKIGDDIVGGSKFNSLKDSFKRDLNNYNVTIAIIEDATNQEIRTLFGRLQEGDPLVPAEKRNAIISAVGQHVDNFAINHVFFKNSRIPERRFKRQDYMAHSFALALYGNNEPLKANLLLKMYLDKSLKLDMAIQKKIAEVLDCMAEIDKESSVRIYKQYHFIDIFYYLYLNYKKVHTFNLKDFATKFDNLESRRLKFHKTPEVLIENKTPLPADKDLFDYINAFRFNGADPSSISTRNRVLNNLFI